SRYLRGDSTLGRRDTRDRAARASRYPDRALVCASYADEQQRLAALQYLHDASLYRDGQYLWSRRRKAGVYLIGGGRPHRRLDQRSETEWKKLLHQDQRQQRDENRESGGTKGHRYRGHEISSWRRAFYRSEARRHRERRRRCRDGLCLRRRRLG